MLIVVFFYFLSGMGPAICHGKRQHQTAFPKIKNKKETHHEQNILVAQAETSCTILAPNTSSIRNDKAPRNKHL
jgi:hypothetical protein